jgi:hypothetical protein
MSTYLQTELNDQPASLMSHSAIQIAYYAGLAQIP